MGPSSDDHVLGPCDFLKRDYRPSIRRKEAGVEYPRRKKSCPHCEAHYQERYLGFFSSQGFGRIRCFKENLDVKLLREIYKRALLPTAKKQLGDDQSSWKLPEDNDAKHKLKTATKWRAENGVGKIM